MTPQAYAPPAYAYQPEVALTADDQAVLAQGEIEDTQVIAGGLVAFGLGLGAAQAIEGRWLDKGWIFTFGEPIALTVLMAGVVKSVSSDCPASSGCQSGGDGTGTMIAGLIGYGVLRIWGFADAVIAPSLHNDRVRALRQRLGGTPAYGRVVPYLAPPADGGRGGIAGLTVGF
jgi:hypothetical protein